MRKINKRDVLKMVLILSLVAGIGFAMGTVGRFVPTHKIVEPVYCGSCHPEQVGELATTTHLGSFAANAQKMANLNKTGAEGARGYGRTGYTLVSDAEAISMGCTMCHNYWENFKWFGVVNYTLVDDQTDNPSPIYDIYGNQVSPYGLGSTRSFIAKMNATDEAIVGVEPWQWGINNWQYIEPGSAAPGPYNKSRVHTRLDYVWSSLSAKSPGPIAFQVYKDPSYTIGNSAYGTLVSARGTPRYVSCGTAEQGLCHIAENAVAMSAADKKLQYPNQSSLRDAVNAVGATTQDGAGVFFTHEMASTTAQYAAKPVKICGACHVLKLPPMKWGGEPWAGDSIRAASNGTPYAEKGYIATEDVTRLGAGGPEHKISLNDSNLKNTIMGSIGGPAGADPVFGITPLYDQTGKVAWTRDGAASMDVTYKTPDWAHALVSCVKCHSHAGINGETVSDNT